MKLFNTLSRTIETIQPLKPPFLGLYACGPTVYDYAHLGHLRKYTMDDVLIRSLRHAGYEVKFVQNITDVGHLVSDADTGEDKLEKGAKKYGQSVQEIARKFEDYFYYSMDLMGNVRPNVSARVTEHIYNQLELVRTLEKKGFTYVIEGDGVYFDTSKFPDYGKLARLDVKNLQEGARVEKVKGKRHPTDFALWKFERPGEARTMIWESPWHPRSFPGWHIECSAIGIEHLGEQFDIHTGGIDHIPVHHTNEIAQSEAATGKKPFVKYWVHHNFLLVEDQKMSKSLGNFFTIDDVIDKAYSPKALRLLFLMSHYRSELNFTWDSLEAVQISWEKLIDKVKQIKKERQVKDGVKEIEVPVVVEFEQRFFSQIENDLKTPEAVALLWEVVRSKKLTAHQKYHLLLEFDEVLGLGLAKLEVESEVPLEIPVKVQHLLDDRQSARKNNDWQQADRLRDEIKKCGFEVVDLPGDEQELRKTR